MKKGVLIAIIGLGTITSLNAQPGRKPLRITAGPELLLPLGKFSDINKLGYGASIQGEFVLSESFSISVSSGGKKFAMKKEYREQIPCGCGNEWNIPITSGGKYRLGHFFGSAEIGATFGTGQQGNVGFVYTPSIGMNVPVNQGTGIEFSAGYQGRVYKGSQDAFLGIRAAYVFGL